MKKVLMVLHAYPPCGAVGALRNSKFAKYLPGYGWDPIVITRQWYGEPFPLQEPRGIKVIRTEYRDRLKIFRKKGAAAVPGAAIAAASGAGANSGLKSRIKESAAFLIKEILTYPDEHVGWIEPALKAARIAIREENPAAIFSSSPPVTSHLIASSLKKEFGLPWVADFRDLWTQNHYISHTFIRRIIEKKLETSVLKDTDLMTTISVPLAGKLRQLHCVPVEVITNGFDPDDYAAAPVPEKRFTITYTGEIYKGKRDPSLFFSALQELSREKIIDPQWFCARFYGPDKSDLAPIIEHYGVQDLVSCPGQVGYQEAVRAQQESSALLQLNWRAPEEKGVYTGKLFEYLGAMRPILAIPENGGVIDDLLADTGAGVVADTKDEIKEIIKKWYLSFKKNGYLSYSGIKEKINKYTRQAAAKNLAAALDRLAAGEKI